MSTKTVQIFILQIFITTLLCYSASGSSASTISNVCLEKPFEVSEHQWIRGETEHSLQRFNIEISSPGILSMEVVADVITQSTIKLTFLGQVCTGPDPIDESIIVDQRRQRQTIAFHSSGIYSFQISAAASMPLGQYGIYTDFVATRKVEEEIDLGKGQSSHLFARRIQFLAEKIWDKSEQEVFEPDPDTPLVSPAEPSPLLSLVTFYSTLPTSSAKSEQEVFEPDPDTPLHLDRVPVEKLAQFILFPGGLDRVNEMFTHFGRDTGTALFKRLSKLLRYPLER